MVIFCTILQLKRPSLNFTKYKLFSTTKNTIFVGTWNWYISQKYTQITHLKKHINNILKTVKNIIKWIYIDPKNGCDSNQFHKKNYLSSPYTKVFPCMKTKVTKTKQLLSHISSRSSRDLLPNEAKIQYFENL